MCNPWFGCSLLHLAEVAKLKASVRHATDAQTPKVASIPHPSGKFSLQEVMKLSNDKRSYVAIRVTILYLIHIVANRIFQGAVRDLTMQAGMSPATKWRHQPKRKIGQVVLLVSTSLASPSLATNRLKIYTRLRSSFPT